MSAAFAIVAVVCILLLHVSIALVTMLRSPLAFLRYHVVLAALYASGLLDLFEGVRLPLPAGEIKLSGGLWLISGGMMAVYVALHPDLLLEKRSFLIRHYRWFILLAVAIHFLFGRPAFSSALHFLELVYPFVVLLLCNVSIRTEEDRAALLRSFLWYGIVLCCLVPVNFLVYGSNEINVLRFARVMSTSLLPAFVVLLAAGLRNRRGWLFAAFGLLVIPLITVSRGVTVAVALAFLSYLLIPGFRGRGVSRGALAVFGIGMLVGGILVTTQFKERSLREGDSSLLDATVVNTSGRLSLWTFFYDKLSSATPRAVLLGEGFGASDDFAAESDPGQWFKQPHNEYLRFLFNFGVVGLLAYFSMYVRYLRRVRPDPGAAADRAALVDASRLLLVLVAVLALFENFILYNPFGFTQNAFIVLALAMQPELPGRQATGTVGSDLSIR